MQPLVIPFIAALAVPVVAVPRKPAHRVLVEVTSSRPQDWGAAARAWPRARTR